MEKQRDLRLDLIRSLALFFTVGMHFMDNSGLYVVDITGPVPVATAMLRMLMTSCVPMFLMLSGWLCNKRTLSRRHYLGIVRILEIYLLASLLCLAYRAFIAKEDIGLRYVFGSIINFYASGYAWYVMMYLGLFLMMPFLNLAFHNLEDRRQRLIMILSFFVLTHLASVMNMRVQLLSVWWTRLYPITYYLTGAFLCTCRPKLSAAKAGGLLALLVPLCVVVNRLVYSVHGVSLEGVSYDHAEVYCISVLLFVLLLRVPVERFPALLRRFIQWVSRLSFGAYLLSWISDGLIYPVFAVYVPGHFYRLRWAIPLTLLSTAIALVLSQLTEWLRRPLDRLVQKALRARSHT